MARPSATPPATPGQEPDEPLEESLRETFPASDATSASSILPAPQPKKGVEVDAEPDDRT